MKKLLTLVFAMVLISIVFMQNVNAQIAVTVTNPTNTTPNLASSYTSLANAITALNAVTAMSGPVIFDLAAGGTETAPATGYLLGSASLNSVTSATNTITFQKSGAGANPLITGFTPGTSTTTDGIWKIQGTDYVTISGLTLQENAANTTATMQMEWGFAIVKLNLSDGSQNINITNCTVSLNKANANSVGIYGGNHIATSTTALVVAAASGTNANIKINGCIVSNCYNPVYIAGYTTLAFYDTGLEIGTTSANTISNYGGGATNTYGIYITGQNAPKIENNSITLATGTTTTAYGINVATACIGYVKINANTISVSSSATTSQLTAINNLAPIATTLDITNNIIQNCNYATATSGSFQGIYEQGATTGCTVNITGNTVTGLTYSAAALAGSGTIYGIYKTSGTPTTVNINNNNINTFTLTGTTGGTFYGIYINSGSAQNANNNQINTISIGGTGTSGTIYGIRSTTGTIVHNFNIIHDLQITKTTSTGLIYAFYNFGSPANENYNSNQIYNLTAMGANVVAGIYANTAAGIRTVSLNTIYALSSNGTNVYGLYMGSSSPNIFKNKIYNLNSDGAGGRVDGININSGTTVTVFNNIVSDLRTPAATGPNSIKGINFNGGTTCNAYNNTIYITGSSTGAGFGTSGIYATATPTTVDLRNNIVVNTFTAGVGGITAAYRRASAVLTNFANTSNNNCWYAGTPSATNLIMYDGTNSYQTLAAYKGAVTARDAASITENPTWVSTTGANATFLHINTSTPTQLESGGTTVAVVTDDFDGDIRNLTTPDIGADEFTGVFLDLIPPTIVYTPLLNTSSTSNRSLAVTITDLSGIGSGANQPVMYWKINAGAYTGPVTPTSIVGSVYTFDFGAGVVNGDIVSYFVIAQDAATTPNIASNPSVGAILTTNPPLATTPPTTPNAYTIVGTICGNKTVGVGGDYTTLTAAIADLNSKEITCPIIFSLIDATYPSETFPIVINANGGSSSVNTVTIKPAPGVTPIITGSVASDAVIKLNGAKYMIFDGSNTVGGTTRDLTISNTNITAPKVILFGSVGTVPIVGNTLKNCTIINGMNTSTAIVISDISGAAGYFNNTTIQNNSVQLAYIGIYALANVAAGNGGGTIISNNDLNTAGANSIRLVGIYAQGIDGITISNNNIGNILNANAESPKGIWLATGTNNATVSGNTISNLSLTNTGAFALTGIYVNPGATTTSVNVSGNTVSNLSNSGTALAYAGILSFSPNTNIINNTVSNITQLGAAGFWGIVQSGAVNSNLTGNSVSGITTTTSGTPSGINLQGASTGVNISKNTIFNVKNTNSGGWGSNGMQIGSSSLTAGTTISNNIIYDVASYGYTGGAGVADNGYGMIISAGGGYNVFYNSIHMNTNQTVDGNPAAFNVTSAIVTANSLDVRNNIFANTQTIGTNRYAIYSGAAASVYSNINYNDYTTAGPNIGNIAAANVVDLLAWKTATGKDANSISELPPFVGPTNLHLQTTIATQCESGGLRITVPAITTDIDNDIRWGEVGYTGGGTSTDIGADEFTGIPKIVCAGTPAVSTITGLASVCINTGTTLSLSTTYSDLGISYQWKSATVSGGPYTNMGTLATQATGNLAVTTYYVCTISCSYSGLSYTTVEKAITINTLPVIGVLPVSSSFCSPSGTPITLTASGGTSYSWSPAGGLSAATGTVVNATPSATTIYTVTGTDANGCINTASATINVTSSPLNLSALATPNTICSGNISNLTATSYAPTSTTVNNYVFTTGTGATLDPMTGATSVLGASDDDTPNAVPAPLGFTFNYDGANYSQFSVSPDGWLLLGPTVAVSQFTNATTTATNVPKIYAFWDDLATGTDGSVKTLVTGVAPYRIFKAQWFVTVPRNTTGPANSTYQVWLYETTNAVELRYGTMGVPTSGSISAGLTGAIATNFNSITYSTNTSSNAVANDLNTTAPASGRIYTFMPPSAAISYAWSPIVDVVSPASQNTATNALTSTTIFTVTATNAGCISTANTTVTVSTGIALNTQPLPLTKCVGEIANFTVGATGSTLVYQWRKNGVPINIVSNPSAATATLTLVNVTLADADNYDVVISAACGAPITSNTVALTVNPLPTVAVTPTTANYCTPSGSSISLTASNALTYAWSPGAGLSATTGTSVSANPTISTIYTVSGTDGNGCINTATAQITVGASVSASASSTPALICSGSNSQLLANGSQPFTTSVVSSYSFSAGSLAYTPLVGGIASSAAGDDGTQTSIPIGFNFNYNGNNFTTFGISTNGTIQLGATATSYINGLATNANVIAPLWDDNNLSAGSITYLVSGSAPNRVLTVDWNNISIGGSGSTANSTNQFQLKLYESSNIIKFNYGPLNTTNGVTASIGLSGIVGNYLSVTPGAPATTSSILENSTISSVVNIPSGTSYTFTPAGGPVFTYAWSPSTFITGQVSLSNPLATAVNSTTIYTVTVTGNAGCNATANTTVTIDPISVGGTATPTSASVCTGTGTTVTLAGNTGTILWETSPDGITWTPTAITTSTISTGNLTTSTYYHAIVTSGVCTSASSTTALVTIDPVTVAGTVSGAATVCSGTNSTILTLAGNTGSVVKWQSSPDGITWSDIANTTNTYTATNLTATTQFRAVVQSGACSAANSTSVTVTVDPVSNGGTLSGGTALCSVTNSTVMTLTGYTGNIVRWESSTDGITWTPIANTVNTYTANNISVLTYFRVVVQSGVCTSANSTTTTFTINTPPVANITGSNNPTVCGASDGSATVNAASSYAWSTTPTQTTQTATGLAAGTYYVTISNGICTNVASVVLSDPSAPTVTLTTGSTTICSGTPVTFTAGGATNYEFFVNGVSQGAYSPSTTFTTSSLANGNTVTVSGITAGCVGNSTGITMTVSPISVGGTLGGSTTVCSGTNSSTLTLNSYTGTIVKWQSSPDGITWSDIVNTLNTYTATNLTSTTYYRVVVASGVCSAANSTNAIITVDPVSAGGTVNLNTTVCSGTNSTVLTLTGNTGNVVKWQSSPDGTTWSDIVNTTNTYTATNLVATTHFRAVVQSGVCSSANSASTTITVDPLTVAGAVTGGATVCNGTNSTVLTLTGNVGTVIKWQSSPDGITWSDIANTTSTYTATNLSSNLEYRAVVQSGACISENSTSATINVLPTISPVVTNSGSNFCLSGTSTLTATPSTGYGSATFQWQESSDNVNFTNIGGATSTSYTTPALTSTTYYRILVKVGATTCLTSIADSIVVYNPQILFASSGSRCGTGTVDLSTIVYPTTIVNWYANATGGASLGTGANFTTPVVSSTTNFYAEGSANVQSFNVGLTANSGTLGAYGGYGMFFSSVDDSKINSIDIYPSTVGTLTITLKNGTGTAIDSKAFSIVAGDISTTVLKTLPLGFSIPAGSSGWSLNYDMNINRSSGTFTYPNTTNGFSITGNTYDGDNITTGARYYFYNWSISTGCFSPRVPVTATVSPAPVITVTANPTIVCAGDPTTLTVGSANAGYNYSWSAGTTPSTGTTVSGNPTINTTFTVTASDVSGGANNGCVAIETVLVNVNPLPLAIAGASSGAISCSDSINLTALPLTSPTANPISLFTENFNGATNSWVTTNTSTATTPALADWTLEPDGYVYGGTTYHSNDSSQFYMSNSDVLGNGSILRTTLESPSFSTVGVASCNLSFYHNYYFYAGDTTKVEVFNGTAWATVANYVATQGTAAGFVNVNIPIDAYAGLPNVKVRFSYRAAWGYYWAIDNVSVTGAQANTFAWTSTPAGFTSSLQNPTGVKPAVTTTYHLLVTTPTGCFASADTTVIVNAGPAISLGNDTTICTNTTYTITATSTATSYLWSNGATNSSLIVGPFATAGTQTFTVTATSGLCSNTATINILVDPCLGISSSPEISVNVQPNPTNGLTSIIVTGLNGTALMSIYNLAGQLISEENIQRIDLRFSKQIDMSTYPKGIYYLKLNNNEKIIVKKIIVN